jgi:hypothetical protein
MTATMTPGSLMGDRLSWARVMLSGSAAILPGCAYRGCGYGARQSGFTRHQITRGACDCFGFAFSLGTCHSSSLDSALLRSCAYHAKSSNQSVELTATRCTPTLSMVTTASLGRSLAFGGGSSLHSRYTL